MGQTIAMMKRAAATDANKQDAIAAGQEARKGAV
jgi:hypothetical protein